VAERQCRVGALLLIDSSRIVCYPTKEITAYADRKGEYIMNRNSEVIAA